MSLNCRYMCLYPKHDYALIFGNWTTAENGSVPECDVFEIECKDAAKNETKEVFYKFLHPKIYRPPQHPLPPTLSTPTEPDTPTPPKPDVHIIILDSVSQSQFIRSLQKTRHVLREYYDAIPFRHLNKVGLNSRPNGYALLFGYGIYPIPKSPMSKGHEPDLTYDQYCKEYKDNDQFIANRFKDDGYATLMSEDWSMGVFNWPGCYGFEKAPTDHYMRPYQLRLEGQRKWRHDGMRHIVQHYSCKESYHYQTQYLQDFINAYPDKPKFSLTWTSYLAHDDINNLYHTDDFFYNFFKDNREKFNNSYVLFMGDHGNRFSFMRYTDVGQTEDRNPFFFLSVPAHLRKNHSFMDTIKENSQQLITHYDIYATLNEIVKPQNPRIPNPHLKGSSFFHPLPQPRTCDKLRIPFEYCQCQLDKTRLPKDNEIAKPAAKLMVERMNENLQNTNDTTDVCASLTLDLEAGIFVDEFAEKANIKVYEVYYKTQPGGGMFSGFLTKSNETGKLEIFSEKFPRMNKYGAQAQCAIESNFAAYCF
uniref:Sulfatase N-terminal domain-containing protein n=1 Tax=Panagrolaimus sp. PS1159 TaxID=55785 RepID=A0AC35EZG2_9BILA